MPVSKTISYVGFQNEPPQDMPHWYSDYFEPKATLASDLRETSAPPFNYLGELELRDFPIIAIIRDNLFLPIYRAGQTSIY